MSNPSARSAPLSPGRQLQILGGAVAFLVVLGLVIFLATTRGRSDKKPLESLSRSCRLEPIWEEKPPTPQQSEVAASPRRRLAIYLDTSEPMGGFFPPSSDATSPLLARLLSVLPDHLQAAEAGPAEVSWYSVAEEVAGLERPTRWTQGHFRGAQSRLRAAVAALVRETLAGRLDLAVLVTDLAATEADTLGAMAAANAFEEQGYAARARAGELHFGIFGVQAPYPGAARPACGASAGFGCRFSERSGRWAPVSRPLKAAVYFLLVGRQRDAVASLAERLGKSAREAGLVPRFELLTEEAAAQEVTATCEPVDEAGQPTKQFTLRVDSEGRAVCANSRIVQLSCGLELVGSAPGPLSWEGFEPRETTSTWPGVEAWADQRRLDLLVDCGAVRSARPEVNLDVSLTGSTSFPGRPDWSSWSTETDETEASVGKTLLLGSFVERLRLVPTSYRLHCPAFLRALERRP